MFVVGGLYSTANGVARIMRDLASAMGRLNTPVSVYGAECAGRHSIGDIFESPTKWIGAPGRWLGGLSWSPSLKRLIDDGVTQADVVHNHSLWMLPNSYSSRAAERHNKPIVITAHGTLEPWSLSHSRWKKQIVARMFQNRDLKTASCIHVNSEQEVEGVRAIGLKNPIAVIPNGINLAEFDELPNASRFHDQFPVLRNKRVALFMARMHQKKGLNHLIRAWGNLWKDFPDWQLVIAGPDCGFGATSREIVEELGLESSVTFVGDLKGHLRLAALSAADMFVQPSFSEGFSMSILEAMACRLPVLITPGCNFPEVVSHGAGVIVQPTVEQTADGWRSLLQQSDDNRRSMGLRARGMIESRYTWDAVARETIRLYQWLIEGDTPPEYVRHD